MKYWLGMILSKLQQLPLAWRRLERKQLKFAAILSCVLIATMFSGVVLTTFAINWGTVETEARVNVVTGGFVQVELSIPNWPAPEIQRIIYPGRVIPFNPIATHTGTVPQYLFIEIAWPNPNYSQVTSRQDHATITRDAVRDFIAASNSFTSAWSGTLPGSGLCTRPLLSPDSTGLAWPNPNPGWVRLETRHVYLNAAGAEVAPAAGTRHIVEVFGYNARTYPQSPNYSTPPVYNAVRVANFLEGLHRDAAYAQPMGTPFPIHVRAFTVQADHLPNALTTVPNAIGRPQGTDFTGAPADMSTWNITQRLANAFRIYLGRENVLDLAAHNVPGF